MSSVVETAQQEKVRSTSWNLFEENGCDVFDTGYSAATEGIKRFSFSLVGDVITEVFHQGVLDYPVNHNFNR